GAGRHEHVGEREAARPDRAMVVLVVAGGTGADVPDLRTAELVAGPGLEAEGVPVLVAGRASEDQRVGEGFEVFGRLVAERLLGGGHGASFHCCRSTESAVEAFDDL